MAGKVSHVLSEELETKVAIGNIRIGLFNRAVLDDVFIQDLSGDSLLSAARLSSKIHIWDLFHGRVKIDNLQLFGYTIHLRKRTAEEPYNFQFIIDKFSSNDSTSTPLDISISDIVIRRGSIFHSLDYEPLSDGFSIAHCHFSDVALEASLDSLTNDNIQAVIKELSFTEKSSTLTLEKLKATIDVRQNSAHLSDVELDLPNTHISLDLVAHTDGDGQWKDYEHLNTSLSLKGSVLPTDFAALIPRSYLPQQSISIDIATTLRHRQIELSKLLLDGEDFSLDAQAQGTLNTKDTTLIVPITNLDLTIHHLKTNRHFYEPILTQKSKKDGQTILSPEVTAKLLSIDNIEMSGRLQSREALTHNKADINLTTSIGSAEVDLELVEKDLFNLQAKTSDLQITKLFADNDEFPVDNLNLDINLKGSLKSPSVSGLVSATDLILKGETFDKVVADVNLSPRTIKVNAGVDDKEYRFRLNADLLGNQDIKFNSDLLDQIQGYVALNDVNIHTDKYNYDQNALNISLSNDQHGHHMLISSDFMDAHADGHFRYQDLPAMAQALLHEALPSVIPPASHFSNNAQSNVTLSVNLWDSTPLKEFIDVNLSLIEPGFIEGSIDGSRKHMSLHADFPHAIYGNEDLRAVSALLRQNGDSLTSFFTLQRMMESGPIDITLEAGARSDNVYTILTWNNNNAPSLRGTISATSVFSKAQNGKLDTNILLHPSQVVISDTVWNVHPAEIFVHNNAVSVHDFQVSQLGRHLSVNGRLSKDPSDTLFADLRAINLQYVFGLIDFHDVEFAGLATGKVKAHNLFTDINVDADLRVDDFTLNNGLLGQLYVTGGFGRKDDRAIDLDAYIHEPTHGDISHVTALIKPGHEPGRGLDLNIFAKRLNTYFLNDFTQSIFTDLQGQASGYAHLHGPFKRLNLEGELALDTLALTVDALGTRYHLLGGDSVHLHNGGISLLNIQVYDKYHLTDNRRHQATLNGELSYQHFKNLSYDFNIAAHDLLGYDFRDFGDQTFYGTVFAEGNVHLSGQPGALNVDLKCRPTAGTVFTYNVSSPESTTDNEFITFKSKDAPNTATLPLQEKASDSSQADIASEETELDDERSDMRINFDLDITPDAQMRLLMDQRSEDYINLFGDGHIRANFYNKGRFQMYGTYRVDHGTYRLSLQDVIRKDFQFQQGSTITFGGDPLKGDLNLQAIYTVPSVSLNDLTVGSNFSASNVRVNCLMNIGGRPEQPQITFDFDIPNVNEDEKQMVRSLISTEEERNLQVIYLLGIGRFYTYGLAADQSQTNAAVQSLLSSTLSGQLNNLLTNAIGNGNWNFGTNLSTGTQGWTDVDVEGMLSGRLLNNRLLINGTFGYRDTPIANTNFIGDFDVQWLLTPSGNLSLKAYSETNDRYFTKSALTTQGIGIQVKKDFNTLRELFRRRK